VALLAATLGALLVPTLAVAQEQQIEVIEDVETVLAVADTESPDFPVASLMRAHCPYLVRIEAEDGSAQEWSSCTLHEDEPLQVPENQGAVPSEPFVENGGECIWTSDYAWVTMDAPVFASEFETVALPSGRVHIWAAYPAEPLACAVEEAAEESPAAEDAGVAEDVAAAEPAASPEA
jgi:hypothetical protein